MKKTVKKCLLTCLVFVFVMAINVPVFAKTSKVVMPKSIKESAVNEDGELSPYNATEYSISYDKNGRIKKISALSKATDGTWTYTISYKKSGKNTKATIKYDPSWGEDPEIFTYKFNSKGRLISNNKSSQWVWDTDESNDPVLYSEGNYVAFFDKNAKIDMYYKSYNGKITSVSFYEYNKQKLTDKVSIYLDKGVDIESVTEELLENAEQSFYKYTVKTSKVSMTDAVKWMNSVMLLDFIYRD